MHMWNPVTIYTVLLLGQRLQIAPVPPSLLPFVLGLVMYYFGPVYPISCGYFPDTPQPTCYRLWCMTWFFQSSDLGLVCTKCMWAILLTHHHQNAYAYTSTLSIFSEHFLRPQHILTYVTHCTLLLVTDCTCCLPFYLSLAPSPLFIKVCKLFWNRLSL